nr:polyprenyl synthetase family protein [Ardenticatena sp.]
MTLSTAATVHTLPIFTPIEPDLRAVLEKMRSAANIQLELLDEALAHVVASGGKLVRPSLAILVSRIYGAEYEKMISLAASLEMLHTATLVHDDMIDAAAKRRGNPTLHTLLNPASAVLLGDYLFAQAAAWATETDNVRVVRIFAQTLMTIVNGELRQMWAKWDWNRAIEDYFNRIHGKTAALFSASCETAAALCHTPAPVTTALREYGRLIGLAFQIVDDVLDYAGDEEKMGKPVGSDLRSGNITLPLIYYARHNPNDPLLATILDGKRPSRDEVSTIVAAVVESDAIERSLAEADRLVDEALTHLEIVPDCPERTMLAELARYIVRRRV